MRAWASMAWDVLSAVALVVLALIVLLSVLAGNYDKATFCVVAILLWVNTKDLGR